VGRHLRSARHRALVAAIVGAREATGLTQRQFAAKLQRSHNFVWRIEAGERQVNVLDFVAIAKAAGLEAAELLNRVMHGSEPTLDAQRGTLQPPSGDSHSGE
jgi:transcriptional regulator with XRE-family HTH domain